MVIAVDDDRPGPVECIEVIPIDVGQGEVDRPREMQRLECRLGQHVDELCLLLVEETVQLVTIDPLVRMPAHRANPKPLNPPGMR